MSLETKIEALTAAIDKLTLMIASQSPAVPAQVAKKQEELPATPTTNDKITVDELQALCLSIVRIDTKNKAKIKDTLSSFGAKVLAELKPSDYADVKTCLEAMKNV